MGTLYKPSQWRGKRVVYRSTDPDEPKRENLKVMKLLVLGIIWLAMVWLVLRWNQ
jgi:hypothetical protein